MDSLDNLTKSSVGKPGFFKVVFNFNDETKSQLLNLSQYAILALVPIVALNKLIQRFIPEADEDKGSLEILFEIIAQLLSMFLGIFFIDRIVSYIPTYSGDKYQENNFIPSILPILVIILSLQTKLGEKVSILQERIGNLWNGTGDNGNKKKKYNGNSNNNSVKVSQPISQQQVMNQSLSSNQGSSSISSLPTMSVSQQNYNDMYQQNQTPLVGAATPGGDDLFEPMAANGALGGGSFGGMW